VDECHHVSAYGFEQVLKRVKARYVLGLTATPVRRDGRHPIILMQCGPIRWRASAKRAAVERPFAHVVVPRTTEFRMEGPSDSPPIQDVYTLSADSERNRLILNDVLSALEEGAPPRRPRGAGDVRLRCGCGSPRRAARICLSPSGKVIFTTASFFSEQTTPTVGRSCSARWNRSNQFTSRGTVTSWPFLARAKTFSLSRLFARRSNSSEEI
jgi:hypothetical protein